VLLRIHWFRIVLGAVLVEVVLFVVAIPLNLSANGRAILLALVVPLCVIATFLGGWWVARRAGGLYLLHGLLVGAVAALIYGGLTWKVSLPTAYIVANYLKLVGGAGGGVMAQSLLRNKPASAK
jgi:putative membrane protein (TIGR04086 family)